MSEWTNIVVLSDRQLAFELIRQLDITRTMVHYGLPIPSANADSVLTLDAEWDRRKRVARIPRQRKPPQ